MESRRDGESGPGADIDEGERAAERVVAALRGVPASRVILEEIQAAVPGEPGPAIRDAWGQPLRCLTADSPLTVDRLAVAAHGGRPIFVSAGPTTGGAERANAALVMRSDELPR